MRHALLSLVALLVLATAAFQYGGDKSNTIGSLGGTMSIVQTGHCAPGSGATSCSVTMSSGSLTTGNLYIVTGFLVINNPPGAGVVTSMVAGSQTYTLGSNMLQGLGCSTGWYAFPYIPICEYVLPTSSTGGTSPVTLNFPATVTAANALYITEVHPSANGSQVGLSNDAMQYYPTAGTSLSGPSVTTSGTNPFTTTAASPDTGGPLSAVNAPYSSNDLFTNNTGIAAAVTGTPATWTLTSGTIFTNALVFSFNPTAFSQGFAMNWAGATSGTTLTHTNAAASMQGWQGCQWTDGGGGGSFTISNTAAQTVLSSFGPLNDGSTLTAGTSLNGVQFTSDGTHTDGWSCNLANGYTTQVSDYAAPFSFGTWFSFDNSCSVNFNFDIAEFNTYNAAGVADFLNETATNGGGGGTCSLAIETQTFTSSRVRNINLLPSEFYWVDYFFDGRQIPVTFTNGSAVISGTNTYTAGKLINFTTTGALPTNFAVGLSYYVCAAGLSGSQFEVAATSNCASPISAGSAGSGTQEAVNVHTGKAYTATAITGATCTSGTTTITTAGLPADGNVVNGITVYVENVTPSVWNGTFPSITVSGNNISYSQTCPGSSYTSGGAIVAQVGSTQDAAARGANQFWYNLESIGVREAMTSGKHVWFGYQKVSLTGQDPLLP